MAALEEIQAAIEKLMEFKERYEVYGEWLIEVDPSIKWPDDPRIPLTTDDYAITLHRTIDAQLHILQEAAFQLSGAPEARGFIGNELNLFMQLVHAINEATS